MYQIPVDRRSDAASSMAPSEFSREGKRMFNQYKNKQTFSFGDPEALEYNPYVQPANKPMKSYPAIPEEPQEYMIFSEYKNAVKENIPKPVQVGYDPKRAYAQELLDQINFKNAKKAEEQQERETTLALRQMEIMQFREEEERKKSILKQKTRDYREMLELQERMKRQLGERDEQRSYTEPKTEVRVVKNQRNSAFNPITGEPYEFLDEQGRKSEPKASEKSLASYGNLVMQARRPY